MEQGEAISPTADAQTATAAQPVHVTTQEWWLIEIWKESRETFKELFKHIVFFLLLIASLKLIHFAIGVMSIPPEKKEVIDNIDFAAIIAALVVFGVSFVIKLLVLAFRGDKKHG